MFGNPIVAASGRPTAEILRKCETCVWTRLVLRTSAKAAQLVLEITEQHADGRRVERRLVLEKQ